MYLIEVYRKFLSDLGVSDTGVSDLHLSSLGVSDLHISDLGLSDTGVSDGGLSSVKEDIHACTGTVGFLASILHHLDHQTIWHFDLPVSCCSMHKHL